MTASGLMVCGTGSDSGKSTLVAALCRVVASRGLKVAPFKAQNMALNSAVTAEGLEIGRAQAAQAHAAGVEPEVAMNPVLLKPTDHRRSQVVVNGRPWATLDAAAYQEAKKKLWPVVTEALAGLRSRFDVVICEGAGSPAEINLLRHDITNLRVAEAAGFPALLVGDIDRGGVFASLFGTVSLLPPALAGVVRGFVINKFRGDPALLDPGLEELRSRTGIPTVGILPWLEGTTIDAEDSLALRHSWPEPDPGREVLDVAAVAFPRISNFTDLDALAVEPAVRVRMIRHRRDLGCPDLVVLPGTKATVADLAWLRETGLDRSIGRLLDDPAWGGTILGICGGYQMLGRRLDDPDGIEAAGGAVAGLGLLPVETTFSAAKITRLVTGRALDEPVRGYEIHHGRTTPEHPWVDTGDKGPEGSMSGDGRVAGTSVHGLFESDPFRRAFLAAVAARSDRGWDPGPDVSFAEARSSRLDRLAAAVESHLDMNFVYDLLELPAP